MREELSIGDIARRNGLFRNIIRKYLHSVHSGDQEPTYGKRASKTCKQRRTLKQLNAELVALGYYGSYNRMAAFARD